MKKVHGTRPPRVVQSKARPVGSRRRRYLRPAVSANATFDTIALDCGFYEFPECANPGSG